MCIARSVSYAAENCCGSKSSCGPLLASRARRFEFIDSTYPTLFRYMCSLKPTRVRGGRETEKRSRYDFLRRRNTIRLSEDASTFTRVLSLETANRVPFPRPINSPLRPRLQIDFDKSIEIRVLRANPETHPITTGRIRPFDSPFRKRKLSGI